MAKTSLSMLVDKLEELCDSSAKIPVVGKILVDREDIYDLLDKLRVAIPEAIRDAERLSGDRDRRLGEVEEEARKLKERAEAHVSRMVKETEIVKLAEAEATRLIGEAKAMAKELRVGAGDYADGTLVSLEQELDKAMRSVRKGREELKKRA